MAKLMGPVVTTIKEDKTLFRYYLTTTSGDTTNRDPVFSTVALELTRPNVTPQLYTFLYTDATEAAKGTASSSDYRIIGSMDAFAKPAEVVSAFLETFFDLFDGEKQIPADQLKLVQA